ncbi:MAG: DinB family protein [Ignavibacteria bacterium]|nr:DinB family protein [Ignavibacteria bacterium]
MFKQLNWVDRKLNFSQRDVRKDSFGGFPDFPLEIFPVIIERFRGTPARLEEITKDLFEKILTFNPDGKWSIKEHAGHLIDLEELGEKRLDDYLNGAEILSPADMTNKKTSEAGYNQKNINELLKEFRIAREHIIKRLENLTKEQASVISIHPRLNQKMRVIDWVYFMSEHDDHHLTSIRLIKDSFK